MLTTKEIEDHYRTTFTGTQAELITLLASELRNFMVRSAIAEARGALLLDLMLGASSRVSKLKVKLEEINNGGEVSEADIANLPSGL